MKYEREFAAFLERDMNAATATVNAYLGDVHELERFCAGRGCTVEGCGSADIAAFLMMLKDSSRSGSTINRKMVSVRKYFEFLVNNGKLQRNPARSIKAPRVGQKDPEFLTVEQVEKLLSQPDDSVRGMRDRALLELMYACGLKASEAADADVSDLDLRIGFISCAGESAKTRIIPIGRPARSALLAYLGGPRASLLGEREDDGALFLNYTGERISRQGIWKIIKFYGSKAGISDDLSPQILRNSFAAHLIQNGADLKSLQELMGNESLTAARLYVTLSRNRIMDVYDRAHPRA